MGFIYCPNCGQSISDQASIPNCPKCYHLFNKAEWQRVQAQKDAVVAEEKRKRQEKEQELNNAKQELNKVKESNKCPSCSAPISWEEKHGSVDGWGVQVLIILYSVHIVSLVVGNRLSPLKSLK